MNKISICIISGTFFLSALLYGQNKENESTVVPAKDSLANKAGEQKCSDCHSALFEKKIKHPLTEKGCEDCHQNNGSEHPKAQVKAFPLIKPVPDLCVSCHAEINTVVTASKHIHRIENEKSCVYCHSPHSASEKKLVVSVRKELCLSCHNKEITITEDGAPKILPNIDQQDKISKVFHPPFQKTCSKSCHNPHGSDNFRMLNNYFPEDEYAPGKTESFALCFGCHKTSLLETAYTNSVTNFRNGERNLHFVHVNKEKGRRCIFCHYPHATNNQHLIRDKVKFGNLEFKLNYLSDSTGGSCFPACHVQRKYDRTFVNPDSTKNTK